MGFLAGCIYAFGGLIFDTLVTFGLIVSTQTPGLSNGTLLAFGALIGMPVIGVVAGLALGIIEVYTYLFFKKFFPNITIT